MIYVFDDRFQRRTINSEKLKNFSELIVFKTLEIMPGKPVEECVIDSVDNPDCILFHKSYRFEDSRVTFETIRQLFTSYNVPVVIFSGGIEGSNKGKIEINMNADLMYDNMLFFLEDFKSNNRINIDTLLWGKRHRLNAMLQLQNSISIKYFVNNDLEKAIENTSDVIRTITKNCIKLGIADLGENIIFEIKAQQLAWIDLAAIIETNIKNQL